VPAFTSWKVLQEAERHIAKLHESGGGLLCLAGAFGSGKTELVEHLVCSAVRNKRFQPVFGAMEMHSGQEWIAYHGVLRGTLSLLEASGQIDSDEEFQMLLANEVKSDDELVALRAAGIHISKRADMGPVPEDSDCASDARSVHSHLAVHEVPFSPQAQPAGPRSPHPSTTSGSTPHSTQPPPAILSPTIRGDGRGDIRISEYTAATSSALSENPSQSQLSQSKPTEELLVGIVVRLMRRLIEQGPVVVTIRASQGTSRLAIETGPFWALAKALDNLALSRGAGNHELLVLVVCQAQHVEGHVDGDRLLEVSELTYREISSYIHLCLGTNEPEQDCRSSLPEMEKRPPSKESLRRSISKGSKEQGVPQQLVHWLSRLANCPRYIEEGLTQLHRAEVIKVINGRCTLKKSLESVNICDWVHTHMVARVISEAEALSTEKQEVLQVATTLGGPFSALDLAAANRLGTARGTAGALMFHKSVRLIMACKELARMGLLQDARDINLWKSHSASKEEANLLDTEEEVESTPLYEYDGVAPAWMIPSALIHQVIGATLFKSHRMQIKRAILVNRAIVGHQKQLSIMPFRATLSLSSAKPLTEALTARQQRWREHNQTLKSWESSLELDSDQDVEGLPMSCLITPLDEETDEEDCKSGQSRKSSPRHDEPVYGSGKFGVDSQEIDDYWRSVSISDFLPMTLFRRVRRLLKVYCLVIVAFGTDLFIILDGSESLLDGFLIFAFVLVFLDLVAQAVITALKASHRKTKQNSPYLDHNYVHPVCDSLVLLVIFFELVWGFGAASDVFLVTRRRTDSLFYVLSYMTKFGACTCRLSAEIQMASNWIQDHPGKWLSENFRRQGSKVHPMVDFGFGREDAEGDSEWRSKQLDNIGNSMAHSVVVTLTIFTVLTIGAIQLTDYSYYPDEDYSMQTWVQLIGQTGSDTATTFTKEVQMFNDFYGDMEYGPFSLCRGANARSQDDFVCEQTVWTNTGDKFSQPTRSGYQVDVQSHGVQASFDFTGPAKREALMRCILFLSMMLTTLVVAVAIDYVINTVVVAPLARVFSIVRMVILKIQEHVPDLDLGEAAQDKLGGQDEVTLLEKAVERVTLLVASTKERRSKEENDWINQYNADPKRRSSFHYIPKHATGPDRPMVYAEDAEEDAENLTKMGIDFDDLASWSFDVFSLTRSQQLGVTVWLLLHNNADMRLNPTTVVNFVERIARGYFDRNPYHNWRHAVDVHHTLHRKCIVLGVHRFLTGVDRLALQVAAVGHDVGHPGYNNLFLEEISHELALRYNDRSPLENMHCATMFSLMQKHQEARIFDGLDHKQWKDARRVCIEVILHTDNAKHFEMIKEMQMLYAANCDIWDQPQPFPNADRLELLQDENNRMISLNALMHGADISNACKPWKICVQWAEVIISEFFLQGDEEKRLGIPVQMLNNRDTLNKPSSQVAFIEFFVAPFNKAMVNIFPPLWQLTECLQANLQTWHQQKLNEVEMEDEKRDTANRQVRKMLEELKEHIAKAESRSNHVVSKKDQLLAEETKRMLSEEKDMNTQPLPGSLNQGDSNAGRFRAPSGDHAHLSQPGKALELTPRSPKAQRDGSPGRARRPSADGLADSAESSRHSSSKTGMNTKSRRSGRKHSNAEIVTDGTDVRSPLPTSSREDTCEVSSQALAVPSGGSSPDAAD
jgi:cAMP-specific phosphodiesterase 4